nr:alpha/beta hydrolase [Allomuricauda sp.]
MNTIKKAVAIFILTLSISINAQNEPFRVLVRGKGEPVLLFPGFSCTGDVWSSVVSELSQNYECHVFTFAGFGDVPAIETPWLPKIKEGVKQYIEDHNLSKSTLIGHSLGGTLGLWLASEKGAEFNQLIIVDALPSIGALMIPNFKSEDIVYDNPYNQNILAMSDEDFGKMVEGMASAMSMNTEAQKQIANWMKMTDRKTYVYGYSDLLKLDLREDVASITVPVRVLAAAKPYGKEMARKTYEEQYRNMGSYDLRIAENAAHFIMYDDPKWFMNQVSELLP